jgi:hypothetical protein
MFTKHLYAAFFSIKDLGTFSKEIFNRSALERISGEYPNKLGCFTLTITIVAVKLFFQNA